MSTTNGVVPIPSSGIVPELFNRENYEKWSIRLRTYFRDQNLWDIIVKSTSDEAADKAWMNKNAIALHAIHKSCSPYAFSLIKHITNAKEAWDTLASMAGSETQILQYSMAEPDPQVLQYSIAEPEPQVLQPIQERSMSTTNGVVPIPSGGIVHELLNKKNYEEWSFRLQIYFKAQDLWDIIVESTSDGQAADKAWMKKNAIALHAIHISCGPHAFSAIKEKDITVAKKAWDELAAWAKREPQILQSMAPIQESNITTDEVLEHEELYNAVWKGDFIATNRIISTKPDVVRKRITFSRRTALHMAAMASTDEIRQLKVVKVLVQNMSKEDLEITDKDGFTALAVAIKSNATLSIAECIVGKNIDLLTIKAYNMLPVAMAFQYGHKEMGRYLYSIMPKQYLLQNHQDGATIFCDAISTQNFDVSLDLLSYCKELAISTPDGSRPPPLNALANLPSAFQSGCPLRFWQRWLYKYCICIDSSASASNVHTELENLPINVACERSITRSGNYLRHKVWSKFQGCKILGIKDIYDMKLVHKRTSELLSQMCEMTKTLDETKMKEACVIEALFLAVERGNVEFVKSILKANPELEVTEDENCMNIFMHAIKFRQPKIFSLIYHLSSKLSATSAIASQKNNMLHIAAKLAPKPQMNRIPGAALQMQSELQWFQEVKLIVPPWALDQKNIDNKTPDELFTEEHKQLMIEGEKWMKDTATSCTVVGALIITIMFAAALTVPGGNNEGSGFPIFLNKIWFMTFIISDALSLFSSTASVLMFLGILTSKYAQQDFLKSLPWKLMFGLLTLFLSIASMMVAFSATLMIMLGHKFSRIWIPVTCLAGFPVALFVVMQFPLLRDIFVPTCGRGIFDKKVKDLK